MLEGDHWMSPPPAYPPILNEGIFLFFFFFQRQIDNIQIKFKLTIFGLEFEMVYL